MILRNCLFSEKNVKATEKHNSSLVIDQQSRIGPCHTSMIIFFGKSVNCFQQLFSQLLSTKNAFIDVCHCPNTSSDFFWRLVNTEL